MDSKQIEKASPLYVKDVVWKETEELVVDRLHDRDRLSLRVVKKLYKRRAWRWWRPAKLESAAGFERQQP